MSDLIDRRAAIDALFEILDRPNHAEFLYTDEIHKALSALPPAQLEIIRCKDCKYAHLTVSGECKHCDAWTDDDGYPLELYEEGNFFCGRAERKEI